MADEATLRERVAAWKTALSAGNAKADTALDAVVGEIEGLAARVAVLEAAQAPQPAPEPEPQPEPEPTPPGEPGTADVLRRVGREIHWRGGRVTLRGVAMYVHMSKRGLEGEKRALDDIRAAGANVVRLCIHPGEFRAYGFGQTAALAEYAQSIGLFVIIDWHSIGEPDGPYDTRNWDQPEEVTPLYDSGMDLAVAFWTEAARRHKHDGAVAFELWNEPLDLGGRYARDDEWGAFRPHWQRLIGVIRAEGAKNLILVSGTHWARNLRGYSAAPLDDPEDNFGFAYHEYQWGEPQNVGTFTGELWQDRPFVVTEWGIPDGHTAPDSGYQAFLDTWLGTRFEHDTAWCWDKSADPNLLSDAGGYSPWGEYAVARIKASGDLVHPDVTPTPQPEPTPPPTPELPPQGERPTVVSPTPGTTVPRSGVVGFTITGGLGCFVAADPLGDLQEHKGWIPITSDPFETELDVAPLGDQADSADKFSVKFKDEYDREWHHWPNEFPYEPVTPPDDGTTPPDDGEPTPPMEPQPEPPSDPSGHFVRDGTAWRTGDRTFAGRYVMAPRMLHLPTTDAEVDAWLDQFDVRPGGLANGVNTCNSHADFKESWALDRLRRWCERVAARGGRTHVWLYGDRARGQDAGSVWGAVMNAAEQDFLGRLCATIDPIPGVSVGYGFDLQEWLGYENFKRWLDFMDANLANLHWCTGRFGYEASQTHNGEVTGDATKGNVKWNTANARIQAAAHEWWEPYTNTDKIRAGLAKIPDRPHFSEDRCRIRPGAGGKNPENEAELAKYIRMENEQGVALIIGNLRGMSTGDQDYGSKPFEDAAMLRALGEELDG